MLVPCFSRVAGRVPFLMVGSAGSGSWLVEQAGLLIVATLVLIVRERDFVDLHPLWGLKDPLGRTPVR